MTRLLAVDPGSEQCGYAIVADDVTPPRVRYVQHGTFPASVGAWEDLVDPRHVDAVAIERPSGAIFNAYRGPGLLDTAVTAGGLAWVARRLGFEVVELPAAIWRAKLIGRPRVKGQYAGSAGDAAVKVACERYVEGMPAKSNAHARDALGLAIVAMAEMRARPARRTA